MAIDAKMMLLNEMEQKLSVKLTVADMSSVLSVLSDELANYDLVCSQPSDSATDDMLDAYLGALAVEGRSEKTIERYQYIIGRMNCAVKVRTRQITVHHIRKYLADEKARGILDRTLDGVRQIFSAYFNWLQREGLIDNNPVANLGAIKYQKKQKDLYSDIDIERMKFNCKNIRDRAIVCFLKATGCRISEMTNLNRDNIDIVNLECKVLGKGNKERIVFMDQIAAMTLKEYLETRKDSYPALFVGRNSERIKPAAVRRMLQLLGEASNVDHVHPHKFRRTTATNLIRHGMAIQEVAAILGHDKLDTTMQYVVLDKSDIKNSYKKYA